MADLNQLFGEIPQTTEKTKNPLQDLLGEELASAAEPVLKVETPAAENILLSDDLSAYHFCSECRQFIKHPFQNRCALTGKPVSPTGDCEHFEPLSPSPKSSVGGL